MKRKGLFYVYILFRPDGRPCYVGKGKGTRIDHHEKLKKHYNPHLRRIIKNAGGSLAKEKIKTGLLSQEAFDLERELIASIGRSPKGPLVNLTDGGDGWRGYKFTDEDREKMRQGQLKRFRRKGELEKLRAYFSGLTDEQRARRSANISRGTRLAMKDKFVREKISRALSGRIHSAERRALTSRTVKKAFAERPELREASRLRLLHASRFKGHKHSEETKHKMSVTRTGMKRSRGSIEKTRKAHLGAKRSPESCKRMSDAQKAYRARLRAMGS